VAVIVIGKLPPEVELEVLIVNTVEQLGLQAPEEKDARVPDGSPAIEKEIG
jgi:hypothetical protein